MKKKRYSAGGGVPTAGGAYDTVMPQYPFPSAPSGDTGPTNNMTVNVAGQEVTKTRQTDAYKNPGAEPVGKEEALKQLRRGGKVKSSRVRGDGIVQRGKTRGKFV